MAERPTGTVTLLFTDIEGSTRLWDAEPEEMAVALRRHDEILRNAIEHTGGYVFKTVGDAFCAAFSTPQSAVSAVLEAQRAIGTEDWPTSRPVRVRMALHTGVCEERDADYFGPVVNRTARLEAVAHGGQVLVSGATAELLGGSGTVAVMPAGAGLTVLGQHRLKDLGRPEQVFQLTADVLVAGFPPLASLDNPELPNNLPTAASEFVGRDAELARLRGLVTSARMVTLAGAGGSGKTRLALQTAAELTGWTGDGVWLAELAAVTDGGQIAAVVAGVLQLPDHGGTAPQAAVVKALSGQDVLLVLDNCEHVIDEAAKFCDEVIRHCPRARILATSREPLGIDGERVYRVPSLSLPAGDADTAADLAGSDAVALFTSRARALDPSFAIDDESAALVASVCRRLDGIPLALELAAARLSSMSLGQVSDRLDQRFRLLTGGSRNAMPRQQTLQATVDWSFGLLNPAERETLLRLSVFSGGFDLEAAEFVCQAGQVDTFDLADLLRSLVDKSLVVADRLAGSVRYRLLETIRQYSAQELLRSGGAREVLSVQARHADYCLRLAELAAGGLRGRDQRDWFRRVDAEWDNMRAALTNLETEEQTAGVVRLCVALQRYAVSRAHSSVLTTLQYAFDREEQTGPQATEALLAVLWMMQFFEGSVAGRLSSAQNYAERALTLARQYADLRNEARALGFLGTLAYLRGDPQEAQERPCAQAVALARRVGEPGLLGDTLSALAITAPPDRARQLRLEAVDCYRQSADDLGTATELYMIYGLDLVAGRIEDALSHLEEAIALAEATSDETFLYFFRCDFGMLRLIQGRHSDALPIVRSCLRTARRTGITLGAWEVLLSAACCIAWQGDLVRAATLHGTADTGMEAGLADRTIMWSDSEESLRAREQSRLRAELGNQAYEDAYRTGRQLTTAQAVELALGRNAATGIDAGSSASS